MVTFGIDYVLLGVSAVSLYLSVLWLNVLRLSQAVRSRGRSPSPKRLSNVTIAVPAHNEEATLAKTLRSLLNLKYPKTRLDIIVVDDGSKDKTEAIARAFAKDGIRLIRQKHSGKAAALNTALAAARGEFFGVVDADSTVEADALAALMPHFSDKRVGAVISGIKVENQSSLLERLQRFEYLFATFFRRLLTAMGTLYITPGVLSVYRRSLIQNLGGFDTKNPTEDIEMALRLQHAFYRIEMDTGGVTHTLVPDSWLSFRRQRMRWCRGHLYNTLGKYRDMMFNRKYGLMGTFQFPLNIITPIMTVIAVSLVLIGTYSWIADIVWQALFAHESLVASAGRLINTNFNNVLLNFNLKVGFSAAILFALGIIMYHVAHRMSGERWRYPFTFLIFMFAYPLLLSSFWIAAIVAEVARLRQRW